ncbi:MAG: aspartyl/asparaginyl beta-hydroxylase domain-containing protein [Melioribacteraceae bacterium]|nr:aspartyl/asparaginyl beta-hydroxylase domain-containing protein [Melioribacteraceae bacterium]
MKLLEDNWEIIKSEIPEFDKNKKYPIRERDAWNNEKCDKFIESLKDNKLWFASDWKNLRWYQFPLIYHNKPIGNADKICPKTVELLLKIPSIQVGGFTLLYPKTKMPIHTDFTGKKHRSMAANMPLTSKNDCLYIKNKNNSFQTKRHKNGEMIIFDATNEHYAENLDNNNIRVILYLDFKTDNLFGEKIGTEGQKTMIRSNKKIPKGIYLANNNDDRVLVYADGSEICKCIFRRDIVNQNKFYLDQMFFLNDKVRDSIVRSFEK